MKKYLSDYRLLIGLFISHILMYYTYDHKSVFWYLMTASILFLISYSILHEDMDHRASFLTYISTGLFTGFLLYGVFWLGSFILHLLDLSVVNHINSLYHRYSPNNLWQYLVLILIVVPGEEIFWRGFIQKRLMNILTPRTSIIVAALLYASVQLYAGFFILPFAALIAGLFWGFLYEWKQSLPLVIVSHLVFDLLLFVVHPLNWDCLFKGLNSSLIFSRFTIVFSNASVQTPLLETVFF